MPARDPRLISGMSARTAQRLFMGLVWGWTAALPLGFVGGFLVLLLVHWPRHSSATVAGTAIALFVAWLALSLITILVAGLRSNRAARAELAGGYTTLADRYDQVDEIDPQSGLVVRPARTRSATSSTIHSIGSGIELGAIETQLTPTGVVVRTKWGSIGTILSIIAAIIGIVAVALDPNNASGWFWLLATLGCLGFFVIPLFAYAYAPVTFYLHQLQAAFPGAKVLPASSTYGDAVGELLPSDAPRLRGARDRLSGYIVFEDDRAIFFSRSGSTLVPFLELPRSRVHSGHVGSIYNGGGLSTSAAVFSVTKDDGGTVELTLGFAPSRLESPMRVAIEIDDSAVWVKHWAQGSSVTT
jgi:hypothetical protein